MSMESDKVCTGEWENVGEDLRDLNIGNCKLDKSSVELLNTCIEQLDYRSDESDEEVEGVDDEEDDDDDQEEKSEEESEDSESDEDSEDESQDGEDREEEKMEGARKEIAISKDELVTRELCEARSENEKLVLEVVKMKADISNYDQVVKELIEYKRVNDKLKLEDARLKEQLTVQSKEHAELESDNAIRDNKIKILEQEVLLRKKSYYELETKYNEECKKRDQLHSELELLKKKEVKDKYLPWMETVLKEMESKNAELATKLTEMFKKVMEMEVKREASSCLMERKTLSKNIKKMEEICHSVSSEGLLKNRRSIQAVEDVKRKLFGAVVSKTEENEGNEE